MAHSTGSFRALPDRLGGALAALFVQALLGWALIAGLATDWRRLPEGALSVFRVTRPSPPPPPDSKPRREPRHRRTTTQSAAPARATPVAVTLPVVPLPAIPTVVAAAQPSTGAPAVGNGSGIAGESGRGIGGAGDGTEAATPPRQIRGAVRDADYPKAAARENRSGGVDIRYLVGTDGRIARCEVVQSSGSGDLDETACRLAKARFRFKPATDPDGRRVPAWVDDGVEWVNHQPPPTP